MLVQVGFTISNRLEDHMVYRAIQFICLDDIVRLFANPKLLASFAALERLDRSIVNPDGRVFDALMNATLDAMVHNHSPDAYIDPHSTTLCIYSPNLRSLTKWIQFVLSRKYAKGWGDPSLRFRIPFEAQSLESLALIGSFKDSAFVDVVLKIGSTMDCNFHRPTREELIKMDRQSDTVISCLKLKLPNVLVDLVLQYLV